MWLWHFLDFSFTGMVHDLHVFSNSGMSRETKRDLHIGHIEFAKQDKFQLTVFLTQKTWIMISVQVYFKQITPSIFKPTNSI